MTLEFERAEALERAVGVRARVLRPRAEGERIRLRGVYWIPQTASAPPQRIEDGTPGTVLGAMGRAGHVPVLFDGAERGCWVPALWIE